MEDLHDIVEFTFNGERLMGIVIEHYVNPLDDFYIIYAEHTIYKYHDNQNIDVLVEYAALPDYDDTLVAFKLKRQYEKDERLFMTILRIILSNFKR